MTRETYLPVHKSRRLKRIAVVGLMVLAVGIGAAYDRVWSNLLLVSYYFLTVALGGTLFLALTYVTGAGWHVAFRRIPEALARLLPVGGVAMLIVLAVRANEYGWHHHGHGDAGTFWFKEMWLTPSFWMARAIGYVVLWTLLANRIVARSSRQDHTESSLSAGTTRLSAVFLVVYALTFSLASIDWIMALEPMWFSTMWGVYHFAGMIQATLAVVIIMGLLLRGPGGPLQGIFNDDHLHDLGKLLIGFSCFWMYIWFSQYMLIWYTNIPEETSYFVLRTHGPWGPIIVGSIFLNWVVPFFVLLPKPSKRSHSIMMKIAAVVLIGRWVDLYIMIFPPLHGDTPVFGIWEAGAIACLIGTLGLLLFRSFTSAKPVPLNDPYMNESIHYHAG